MNNLKKTIIYGTIIFTALSANVFALENNFNNFSEDSAVYSDFELRDNQQVVNSSITPSGVSWNAFFKTNAKIYINNTTNENMRVVLRKNGRYYTEYIINPGSRVIYENGTGRGHFSLDFSTGSGYLSGNVAVRISDETY